MNPKLAQLSGKARFYARKSMELPLDDVDEAPEDLFNRIIWHAVKGPDVRYPKLALRTTPRASIQTSTKGRLDDD